MGRLITPNYAQEFLLPASVEDWVPEGHPARYVREYVGKLKVRIRDLADVPESMQGRPQYAKSLLMSLWVYGYLTGIRSTRKLEQACREVMPMIWLAGLTQPDHNTLWRFWKQNRKLIGQAFRELVKVAIDEQMVGFVLQAIDGTKIHAASSTAKAVNRRDMERLIAHLNTRIEELEKEIAAAGAGGADVQKAKSKVLEASALKAKFEQNIDSWADRKQHLDEPEAVMMKGHGLAYNAQIVVDEASGIIVTENVVTDANDQKQLNPMLDATHAQLGRVAEETLADGGYNNAEAIGTADASGYSILLNRSAHEANATNQPYHAINFRFDPTTDTVICPQNKHLSFEREVKRKRQTYPVRIFRGRECASCPVLTLCTKDRRGRSIEITPYEAQTQAHRTKFKDPEKRALLRTRMTLAERPFATIKHHLGIRRFRTRGLDQVRTEWSFICLVHNLKTLIERHVSARTTSVAILRDRLIERGRVLLLFPATTAEIQIQLAAAP
jgi:transposase